MQDSMCCGHTNPDDFTNKSEKASASSISDGLPPAKKPCHNTYLKEIPETLQEQSRNSEHFHIKCLEYQQDLALKIIDEAQINHKVSQVEAANTHKQQEKSTKEFLDVV
ncbi:hypothetical protein M422DRAFT_242111 [Sphaerobolus stellatus SS14]|nr:hypothetical protein M422DRAFT_242111 [Sphaerobolus stellatus SS14]